MTIELGTFIAIVGTLAGLIFGYSSYQRANSNDVAGDARDHTELKTNLDYIKRGVDDIRIDLRAQESKVNDLSGAIIRVEEMAKSAHRRLDTMENKVDK